MFHGLLEQRYFRKPYGPGIFIFIDRGTDFWYNKALWCDNTQLELLVQHSTVVREIEVPLTGKLFWKEGIPPEMNFEGYCELIEDYTPRSMIHLVG
jgi:hypothetical protein